MSIKKVKIHELISQLVSAVDNIEAMEISQAEKTRKFKSEGKKFKSKIYTDKRKFRGHGLKNRITINTFSTYLSRARKPFDNRLHHSFSDEVKKLSNRYSLWSNELNAWCDLPAPEVRKRHGELISMLRQIVPLAERLASIKLGSAGAEKKLATLSNQYPLWKGWIMELAINDYIDAQKKLNEAFRQGLLLLENLHKIKISHEIVYALSMEPGERASLQTMWGDRLSEKKRRTVTIDYPMYMQRILDILNGPEAPYTNADTRKSIAPLAFALAAVSGRRLIEIARLGVFEKVDKYRVKFFGQAKKRESDDSGRIIYTLCDSDLFLKKMELLRIAPATSDFDEIILNKDDIDTRTKNQVITDVIAQPFNSWVKDFMGDDRRVFKDSRALYARIAYETWFTRDSRWNNCDEDVFFAELLGHDDEDTQIYYKQFKLRNFSLTWKPELGQENTRLAALEQLDSEMPSFANGDAGVRLHEWVKEQIRENPAAKITTYSLRKKYGANPQLAARYLVFAADALGQAVAENGRYETTETPEPIVVDITTEEPEEEEDNDADIEDDEIEVEEEDIQQAAETQQDKPRITPQRLADGEWQVNIVAAGRELTWSGPSASSAAAMQAAWEEFSRKPEPVAASVEMPRPRLQLVDGWWTSSIEVDGKTLVYIEMEGTRDQVLEATREAWEKL